MSALTDRLGQRLNQLKAAGTYKTLRRLTAPMGPTTRIAGRGEVVVLCSNNYLGLANHPEVVEAGIEGLHRYGAGTASVRFICGTFDCHAALEEQLADFLGAEAALTYVSCWAANEGLLTNLVDSGDALLSDELNHASIIDAGRLARQATRKVYRHNDMAHLEESLLEAATSEVKVIVADGVFSMEGSVCKLPETIRIARRHGAAVVIDDSHGLGVLGKNGRGVHEHYGLPGRGPEGVDVFTGTLGKSLGGAAGGFVAGPKEVIETLVQKSRPQLFSNALPPTVACSAAKALEVLRREPERVAKLQSNVVRMRTGLRELGYEVLESPTAILPIIVGETAQAIRMSERLLELGLLVTGFGFPVVPEGAARLRLQMSAAHDEALIDRALAAFKTLRAEFWKDS